MKRRPAIDSRLKAMQEPRLHNAILLIDKPSGITSFETIRCIKRILGTKKIGHSGTLDKFASGLLIVCTGKATKLTRFFLEDSKRYRGIVRLGIRTETDDRSGCLIEDRPVEGITEDDIRSSASRFIGEITQMPPHYSALKIKGTRASDIVRKGGSVALKERRIVVHRLDITDIDLQNARFSIDVECSKGTYIRSLARDIGSDLGTGAHLEELRRTGSGLFSVSDAVTIDEFEGFLEGLPERKSFFLTPGEALSNFSSLTVSDGARKRVLNGAAFQRSDAASIIHGGKKTFIIFDGEENVIAIADIDIEKWHVSYLNIFQPEIQEK